MSGGHLALYCKQLHNFFVDQAELPQCQCHIYDLRLCQLLSLGKCFSK